MTDCAAHEDFVFVDEPDGGVDAPPLAAWHILVVDDEPDVHAATRLALKGLEIEGRSLAFSHAHTVREAQILLERPNDFAVALIDVVMETEDAGLRLVRYVRDKLANSALRIVLRTGQPGYAPELQTIQQYDINDYRTKSELTQVRLFTSLAIAIRAYAQIQQLESGHQRLARILDATLALGKATTLEGFAQNLLAQLDALLAGQVASLAGEHRGPDASRIAIALQQEGAEPCVLAATAPWQDWAGQALDSLGLQRGVRQLQQTLQAQDHCFDDGVQLFIPSEHAMALAVWVDLPRPLQPLEQGLLEVFASNVSVAFENLQLYLDINELAFVDDLVGLPNRNAMVAALDAQEYPQGVLALLDLDGFADINSVLDAHFGDAVLQTVAQRLEAEFAHAREAVVARVGGDLFGVYGLASAITPQRLAQVFAQPFAVNDGEPLRLSATAGLVQSPGEGGVAALKDAGVALKQAKRMARGASLYFDPTQSQAAGQRMQLLNRLRAAFSEQRLCLYYQPCVELRTGRVVGAECLLRWQTAPGKFIPPDQFIPLAEQSGLMLALGRWVVSTALRWRKGLSTQVADDFRVAINVSQVQFAEPDFVSHFLAAMEAVGVSGQQVEIELTESVAVGNVRELEAKLAQLRKAGIRVAMDDFGTGYSSLSILQRLAVDKLKIDRSFVSGGPSAADNFQIAHTIISLARHLQLATLAEGIETEAQRQALLSAGCELGQGYLFSRPLPEDDFQAWLDQQP